MGSLAWKIPLSCCGPSLADLRAAGRRRGLHTDDPLSLLVHPRLSPAAVTSRLKMHLPQKGFTFYSRFP